MQMMAANRDKMSASCTRGPLMTQGQREGRLDAFTVDFGPRTLKNMLHTCTLFISCYIL